LLFFFQGSPGLVSQQTDWKMHPNEKPASIDMTVGKVPVHAKYWPDTDEVEIQGTKYKRSTSNVFLVTGIDGTNPVVKPLGIHDLTFKPDELPPVAMLRRDANVWAAVTGHSPSDHPTNRDPGVSHEIVTLDAEGLRLLNTDQFSIAQEDWKQIAPMLTAVEAQLDKTAKLQAEQQSRQWMAVVAGNEMDDYSRQ
jgi:hypothetical protein